MSNIVFCVDQDGLNLTGASSIVVTGKNRLPTLDYTVPSGAVGSFPINMAGSGFSLQCVAYGKQATGNTKLGLVYVITVDGSNGFVYDNHGDIEGIAGGDRITNIALLDAPGVLKYENGSPFIRYTGVIG